MNKVELFVKGKRYDGWKDVDITMSIKALASSFALSITDRWSDQLEPWIIAPDDECEIKIDGQTIITGYVDSCDNSFNKNSRTISVSGRDKTGALVDCSFVGNGEYQNISLKTLADIIVKQFGLKATISGSAGANFEAVKANQGETCFELLERHAKQKGFLLTTDGLGGVLIMRPTTFVKSKTILEQGQNLLSAGSAFDHTDRFSEYIVKGQKPELEEAISNYYGSYQIKATVKDEAVKRYKPMLVVSDGVSTLEQARTRAQWEMKVKAGKAAKFKATTVGWTKGDGSLWKPNELVNLRSTYLAVNEELLITTVKLSLNATAGTLCELELERKDAYLPEPVLKEAKDPLISAIRSNLGTKPPDSIVAPKNFSGGRPSET